MMITSIKEKVVNNLVRTVTEFDITRSRNNLQGFDLYLKGYADALNWVREELNKERITFDGISTCTYTYEIPVTKGKVRIAKNRKRTKTAIAKI